MAFRGGTFVHSNHCTLAYRVTAMGPRLKEPTLALHPARETPKSVVTLRLKWGLRALQIAELRLVDQTAYVVDVNEFIDPQAC